MQTAGEQLRVTSSLVDAETGASVWSMQFARPLRDIFAVEDEIAAEVARAMKVSIDAGAAALADRSQDADRNFDAYLSFLRGRALLANQRIMDLPAAVDSLAAAIRQDPQFAAAYVLLARARVELAQRDDIAGMRTPASRRNRRRGACGWSMPPSRSNPANGEAFIERGYPEAFYDIAGADADFRRGLALAPTTRAATKDSRPSLFQSVARRREALEMLEKARRSNPLEPRLDIIKATFLGYGPGDVRAGDGHPPVGPGAGSPLHPCARPSRGIPLEPAGPARGQHQLAEQAVTLDPGNAPAWRQLCESPISMSTIPARRKR